MATTQSRATCGRFVPAQRWVRSEPVGVALSALGDRDPVHLTARPAELDAWDAKGLAELILRTVAPGRGHFVTGDGGSDVLSKVFVDGADRGHVVRVPLDAPVWAAPAFGVEIVLGSMPNGDVPPPGEHAHAEERAPPPRKVTAHTPLPTMPATAS